MKLSSDYSSDISSLLNMKKNDSLFISTWDKDEEVLPFPFTKIKEYNKLDCHQANKYFFSDEFLDLKNYILSENIEFKKNNIASSNFTFVSNGTIAAWLSILTILKEKKHIRALLLSPVYYIYIEILKQLNIDIYVESAYNTNFDSINSTIVSQEINLVIINNPLFGTGTCIPYQIIIGFPHHSNKAPSIYKKNHSPNFSMNKAAKYTSIFFLSILEHRISRQISIITQTANTFREFNICMPKKITVNKKNPI